MKILVTGATGFLGHHVVRQLLAKGHHVRILRRRSSSTQLLTGLSIETALGDVTDFPSVLAATQGREVVFHVAGHVSFWKDDREIQTKINVQGTRNLVQAALQSKVRRLVHTSSIAAIGIPPEGQLGDETLAYNWWPYRINYCNTKYLAELEIQRGVEAGLDAVIVNPATIFGAGDINLNAGALILQMKKGRVPFTIPGGCCTCDVEDVARGHLLALERGQKGERYVLGGENLTWREIMNQVAQVVGVDPPKRTLPAWAFSLLGRSQDLVSLFTHKAPPITRESALFGGINYFFSSEKARRELGYTFIPFQESAAKTYRWYFP